MQRTHFVQSARIARQGLVRLFASLLVALAVGGCSVFWVSAYDKESVDRTLEISRGILSLFQQLMATDEAERARLVAGPLQPKYGQIDTQIRVHLLRERVKAQNGDSCDAIAALQASWKKFSQAHRSKSADALKDVTLEIERGILERELQAVLQAEEAKKLGGAAKN